MSKKILLFIYLFVVVFKLDLEVSGLKMLISGLTITYFVVKIFLSIDWKLYLGFELLHT